MPVNDVDGLDARLKDLGADAAARVAEPLDPDTVRRLGTRRRHRRWVGTMLLAVILVVSGGVGVFAVGVLPGRQPPSPAGHPTSSPTSPAPGQPVTTEPSERVGHAETTGPRRSQGRQPSAPAPYPTYSAGPSGTPSGTPQTPDSSSSPSASETLGSAEPTESSDPETSAPAHAEPPEATKPPATSGPGSGDDGGNAPAPDPGDTGAVR